MFKQIMAFGLALVGAGVFAAQPVFADTTTTSGNISTTISGTKLSSAATTDAQINLTAGDLKITQAPDIDFGSQEITATGKTYTAKTVSPDLQVLNAGHDQDWFVTVKLGSFTSTKGRTLKGAEMYFDQFDSQITSDADNTSQGPTGSGFQSKSGDGITAGGAAQPIILAYQSEAKGNYDTVGIGRWTSRYSKISMYVPAGNVEGDYSSTLTWTLVNALQ